MKIIMHIDVNNAFLSWMAVKLLKEGKYDIRNSYAVIGGDESLRHGIVLAKSYPAKSMGIKTAQTLFEAKKLCPALRVYKPDYAFYKKMSNAMFKLIESYTPDIQKMSIDECFLDYTPVKHLYGDEIEFAYKLKNEIYDKLGFTVNIGISYNKLCAKMASDFEKPNKVHTLFKEEIPLKMWPLQVDDLFGVGKRSAIKLHNLNIHTIYDLAHADANFLYKHFKNMGFEMVKWANGVYSDFVDSSTSELKGIGNETTLIKDIYDKRELEKYLLSLCENVCLRLRREEKYAYVVAVTIKDKYFKRKSHQKKLVNATNLTDEIYKSAVSILSEMDISDGVRLIGVRLDNLTSASSYQVSFFEDLNTLDNNSNLDKTLDGLKEKYGTSVIKKASSLNVSSKY